MTVFGRLGALIVVFSGVSLLFVDGLRSPPGLWYAASGIVAGTTMMAYTVIPSPFPRRLQPAPDPTYSSTSNVSTTASTTRQTDSQSVDAPQTDEYTKSTAQETEPASDDTGPSEPPTSEKKLKPSSITVKRPQRLPKKTQTTHRTASYTHSSRTKKTAGTSIRQNRHVTSTASLKRSPSTGVDNQYLKPVDSSREIKFAQIDTRFSYLDIDLGPEFIGLDPIPDLIEVDVGPSAVSHEFVRSPVEIKISSSFKALLAPTPRSSGTAVSNDSAQPSMAADNHARRQTDNTAARQRSTLPNAYEARYGDRGKCLDYRCEPLSTADRWQHPAKTWLGSPSSKPENHRPTTSDTIDYGSYEEMGAFDGGRSSDRRSLGSDPVMLEESVGLQEVGIADDPTVDMEMNYSLPRWKQSQWDADPFGVNGVAPGFSEPEESVAKPVEEPKIGFGISSCEAGTPIDEPELDPETGAEMLGLDRCVEPSEGVDGPSVSAVENGPNPLFPEPESFFSKEDAEVDWPTF